VEVEGDVTVALQLVLELAAEILKGQNPGATDPGG